MTFDAVVESDNSWSPVEVFSFAANAQIAGEMKFCDFEGPVIACA